MSKRVAVVTGSNKGIGYEIVRELCSKFHGDVFLTARNEDRGRAAVEKLKSEGSHPKFHQLDITDDASIKSLAMFLKQNYARDTTPFAEQAVNTMKVNFSGTLKVCLHLFPLLRSHARHGQEGTHEAKRLGVSSLFHFKDRNKCSYYNPAKKFLEDERADIVVNAVHPGFVITDMTGGKGELTPSQGAEAPVYLALLPPNVESPRGEFVWNDKTVACWTT
ncbi:carbonyl reductase 1 [Caerostris extrusa]|uniref:Carbonyl reductase 1 n=1 Tax=Caerostris extrusa TaxID=172846 RepID=A0AAV4MWY4_CAEEX|nr:carbonyl reductase 1 [Caerostris extrusa]